MAEWSKAPGFQLGARLKPPRSCRNSALSEGRIRRKPARYRASAADRAEESGLSGRQGVTSRGGPLLHPGAVTVVPVPVNPYAHDRHGTGGDGMADSGRVFVAVVLSLLVLGITSCGDDAPPQGERPVERVHPPAPARWPELAKVQRDEAERLGIPAKFENEVGMRFVLIPPGTFLMGSTLERWKTHNNQVETQHEVTLTRPFYIQITEVTFRQYKHGPGRLLNGWYIHDSDRRGHPDSMRFPVEVERRGAVEFATWLSERDGTREYRLPTEAEWEYACRAGTNTRYWSGNSERDLRRVGWFRGNLPREDSGIQPVGGKPANPWGLYDVHGNASEWVLDKYRDYSPDPVRDPLVAYRPDERSYPGLYRGGSYRRGPEFHRCAARNGGGVAGFRLVSLVPESGE